MSNFDVSAVGGWPGFVLLLAWTFFWKGLALWHAAKRDEKKWFVALLILNTLGILEIIYLFFIVKIKLGKRKEGDMV